MALRQNPQVGLARSVAQAAGQVPSELRSAYYPVLGANLTGAGALDGSRIAAGGLNNPVVYDRLGMGFTVSQMITAETAYSADTFALTTFWAWAGMATSTARGHTPAISRATQSR